MRKIFTCLAALALLLPLVSANQSDKSAGKRYNVYGVMFYNLENLFDTINTNDKYDLEFSPSGARQWNDQKYWQKQHNMAYAISQMTSTGTPNGPAVIGVSEIENISVLKDLVRQPELKSRRLQIVHHDSPDRRGVDVGLLYDPRLYSVTSVNNHRVVIDGRPDFRTRDLLVVTGMLAGEKVSFIVGHWPSRLGGQEQSSYLREAVAALARHAVDSLLRDDPNQGVMVMGDFNDDPHNKSCAQVLGGKRNIEDVKQLGDMYNPWWKILDKGIGTLAYKGAWNLFDQIVISDYFLRDYGKSERKRLTFLRAEVLNRDFLRTSEGNPLRTFSGGAFLNGYSDHFPTEVFLVRESE